MSKPKPRKAAVVEAEKARLDKLAAEAAKWAIGPVDPGTWKPAPEALIEPGTKVEITHTTKK